MSEEDNQIWYKDIFGFMIKYDEFVPIKSMTLNEKLNSIVRLVIYVSTMHYLIFKDSSIFTVTICTMVLTAIYYMSKREFYSDHKSYSDLKGDHDNSKSLDCTKPNKHNPFMNVLMNEYIEKPDRPEACDVDDNTVQKQMNDAFFSDVYRDVDDAFDRKSSNRQFFTMPNTKIPNNQNDYVEWLYGMEGKSYKEGNGERHSNFAPFY